MRTGQIVQLTLLTIVTALTAVAFVVIIRTIIVHPLKPEYYCDSKHDTSKHVHRPIPPSDLMFERFQKALTFRTITTKPKHYDKQQLLQFIDFIQQSRIFVYIFLLQRS